MQLGIQCHLPLAIQQARVLSVLIEGDIHISGVVLRQCKVNILIEGLRYPYFRDGLRGSTIDRYKYDCGQNLTGKMI